MQTLAAVIPVIGMMLLGFIFKQTKLLSRAGIDDIKILVSRVMLPVAVFHALATATFTGETVLLVVVILIIEIATFGAGFLVKRLFHGKEARYIPYLMSLYEGGMFGYPLYTNLCGSDNLSKIAILDIAGLLFGFSIWMGMLQEQESGEKISPKALLLSALHTPAFIAAVLGVIFSLTGWIRMLLLVPAGSIYSGVEEIITGPINALILLAVGYDISPSPAKIKAVFKPVLLRAAIQACAAAAGIFAVTRLFPGDIAMAFACLIYMSTPTTFSMETYIRDPEGSSYVSTVNSLYIILTIIIYCAATIVWGRIS